MKKLLSIMSSLTITTAAVASVVACGVPTRPLDFYVDGLKEYKYKDQDNKDVTEQTYTRFSNDGRNALQSISIMILNSLTYSETKYPDEERRKLMEETLGDEGVNFSLEKKIACENSSEDNCKDVNKIDYQLDDNEKENFKDSITKSTKDSKFTAVDVTTGLYSKDSEGKGSINANSSVQKYDETKVPLMIVDEVTDSKRNVLSFNKTKNPKYTNQQLDTLSKALDTKTGFTMSNDEFDEWWKTASQDEWYKNTGTSESSYKSMRQSLTTTKSKYKKGLYLFGDYTLPTSTSAQLVKPDKITENGNETVKVKETYNLSENSAEWNFFLSIDEKKIQSQMANTKDQTFVYAEGKQQDQSKITFKYFDAEKEENYDIEITGLNNIALGFALKGAKIDEISKAETIKDKDQYPDLKDATKVSTYAFWYEPFGYQFYNKNAFAAGDKDIFKLWSKNEPTIAVKKEK